MQRAALLPVIIIAAVVVGGLLYLYGGTAFHQTYTAATNGNTAGYGAPKITELAHGADAPGTDTRVNYRITSQDQLTALWQSIYSDNGPSVPNIDFTRYEVLGLFDGSHSTDGYDITLASLKDTQSARVVTILHTEPGDSCAPTSDDSSPYVFVQVEKSSLPLSRIDQAETHHCE